MLKHMRAFARHSKTIGDIIGRYILTLAVVVLMFQSVVAQNQATVPHVVQFSGALKLANGSMASSAIGVSFALYKEQQGGTPLWMETQNVQPDANGFYSVLLGATKTEGLPGDLFTSNEARWLGVQPAGEAEQPRVLLLSVPYALKAADAETLGGRPASDFALAAPLSGSASQNLPSASARADAAQPNIAAAPSVAGSGVPNFIPKWRTSTILTDSTLFEAPGNLVGINTTTPVATLEVVAPNQLGVRIDGPASGVGSGLNLQTTGSRRATVGTSRHGEYVSTGQRKT